MNQNLLSKIQVVNKAQETGVLLSILAEKLEIELDAEFWTNLVKQYQHIQKQAVQFRQEIVEYHDNQQLLQELEEEE